MRAPRKLVALAAVALAVTTACGKGDSDSDGGGSEGSAEPTSIASADEVLKVVDKGFAVSRAQTTSSKTVNYGFVIENVSDEVAVTVRVGVRFTDEAGKPVTDSTGLDVSGGAEFSVVLPGQRIGAGGTDRYDGEAIPDDIEVAITLIATLDTPDGERHLKAPGSYAELKTGDPVQSEDQGYRRSYTAEVTNTYEAPIRPRLTAVVRDPEGKIVGGASGEMAPQEIQPGASAPVEFFRDTGSPKLADAPTIECWADPALGKVIVRNPVWQAPV